MCEVGLTRRMRQPREHKAQKRWQAKYLHRPRQRRESRLKIKPQTGLMAHLERADGIRDFVNKVVGVVESSERENDFDEGCRPCISVLHIQRDG